MAQRLDPLASQLKGHERFDLDGLHSANPPERFGDDGLFPPELLAVIDCLPLTSAAFFSDRTERFRAVRRRCDDPVDLAHHERAFVFDDSHSKFVPGYSPGNKYYFAADMADGVSAVRKAAREELRRGAHQVKIMASGGVASPSDPIWNVQYSGEEMRAIVEEAQSWRTYALAHAYTPEAISRAIGAGVRSIEHGNLLDAATAARMHEAGAYLVPTLVTYFAIDELGRALGFPAASVAKVKDVLDAGLASLETAKAAGVSMGFGTDLLGETHEQQSREFSIRAQVLSPAEILRSATVTNAEILNRSGELGVIAPGALADLLVVDIRCFGLRFGKASRRFLTATAPVPVRYLHPL